MLILDLCRKHFPLLDWSCDETNSLCHGKSDFNLEIFVTDNLAHGFIVHVLPFNISVDSLNLNIALNRANQKINEYLRKAQTLMIKVDENSLMSLAIRQSKILVIKNFEEQENSYPLIINDGFESIKIGKIKRNKHDWFYWVMNLNHQYYSGAENPHSSLQECASTARTFLVKNYTL